MKLSEAQQSLVRIYRVCGPFFTGHDVRRHGLANDLRRTMRAKLIQRAGYETTGKADDWLSSEAGRAALKGSEK